MKYFIICCYDNWNGVFFSISKATTVKKINSLEPFSSLSILTPWKIGAKQIKIDQEKLPQSCIF